MFANAGGSTTGHESVQADSHEPFDKSGMWSFTLFVGRNQLEHFASQGVHIGTWRNNFERTLI